MLECDVLVVGAGPAGSAAALAAASAGSRVLMIDRKKIVGSPVQCAEYIPAMLASQLGVDRGAVAQSVSAMNTHLPDGRIIESAFLGLICNREVLDLQLAGKAAAAGAELRCGVSAHGFDGRTVIATGAAGEELGIKPQVIVGADGPLSAVRKWMRLEPNRCLYGKQYLLPLGAALGSTEIYFRRGIPGGYGWVFPKGENANVGIGIDMKFGILPSRAMESFTAELLREGVIADSNPLARTGGMVPVGGQSVLRRGNIILAGDAAGHCHPMTGAGVPNAILAGGLAGETAALAAKRRTQQPLAEYEENCRIFLGDSLALALKRRLALEPCWRQSDRILSRELEKNWIAFEEYYEH